ncbi:MAG: M48 family metalloprotease [Terriglobia bacterium]|nr:M48 family metalloprotease [Terriglobia bacterium]
MTGSKQDKLRKKYDITKIGARSIGAGLNFYSFEREARLGKDIADQIDASVKLNTDPLVNGYIGRIALKLVTHSDSKIPLTVKVIYDAQPNAFAVPGGYLYVTTGLILFCDDEAELAGAMAHEIAHIAARHGTKNLTKRELWGLAAIPLTMVGGPAGAAVTSFASVAGPLTFLKLGRNEELEADLLGVEYAYLAGYDPQEFIKFFEKTKIAAGARANFFGRAFATHPQAEDRIRRVQSGVQILLPPRDEYILDTNDFQEVKSALASDLAEKAAVEKPVLLHSTPEDPDVPPDEQETQD